MGAEHGCEIGACQPARVGRHRVRAHEVIRRELRACRSADLRWGRRRRSRASSGTRARRDARTCTPDRRPRCAGRSCTSPVRGGGHGCSSSQVRATRWRRILGEQLVQEGGARASGPDDEHRRVDAFVEDLGMRGECRAAPRAGSRAMRTMSLRAMHPAEQVEVGFSLRATRRKTLEPARASRRRRSRRDP